jgi:hypothetical protein
MEMARELARVSLSVSEGNYQTDRRGDIQVTLGDRYYGGRRLRKRK